MKVYLHIPGNGQKRFNFKWSEASVDDFFACVRADRKILQQTTRLWRHLRKLIQILSFKTKYFVRRPILQNSINFAADDAKSIGFRTTIDSFPKKCENLSSNVLIFFMTRFLCVIWSFNYEQIFAFYKCLSINFTNLKWRIFCFCLLEMIGNLVFVYSLDCPLQ